VDDAALIKQKLKGKEAIAAASVVSEPVSKKIRVAGGGGGGRSTNLAGFTGPIPPPSNHRTNLLACKTAVSGGNRAGLVSRL
jgi:hypothetical protein